MYYILFYNIYDITNIYTCVYNKSLHLINLYADYYSPLLTISQPNGLVEALSLSKHIIVSSLSLQIRRIPTKEKVSLHRI